MKGLKIRITNAVHIKLLIYSILCDKSIITISCFVLSSYKKINKFCRLENEKQQI